MTAVKPGDVERAVRERRAEIALLLFYGPDSGRVAERARAAAEASARDPADPFQFVRLDGDDVADQPGKLVEEATTYGLFGERRVIWIRPTSRNLAAAVSACLDAGPAGTLIVIEAGDLQKSNPLRVVCESSDRALALPCFTDETRDLATILADMARQEGLAIDPDARDLLIDSLGGDRLASRGEIEKLALYARGRDRITAEDVAAVTSDVSSFGVDSTLDAAFQGDLGELEAGLRQLAQHGTPAGTILSGAMRHALSLAAARASLDAGQEVDAVMRSWRGLHFRRKPAVQRQVTRWRGPALARVISALQTATLESRVTAGTAQAVTSATLFRIADAMASRSASRGP